MQEILGCAPLMDEHTAAQERVSNPALSWLRAVALVLDLEGKLGQPLTASALVEACDLHGLAIPGLKGPDEDHSKRQVGVLMRRVFGQNEQLSVESYLVSRGRQEYRKPSGDWDFTFAYTFSKANETTQPPKTTQDI